jgi:hypothetical protein
VDGIVMVVDSQRERAQQNIESIYNLQANLRLLGVDPAALPTVVQFNKRDLPNAVSVATLGAILGVPDSVPCIEAVAKQGIGVFETLKAILRTTMALIPEPADAPPGRSPSILPGRHLSMFPGAEPPALDELRGIGSPRVPRDV